MVEIIFYLIETGILPNVLNKSLVDSLMYCVVRSSRHLNTPDVKELRDTKIFEFITSIVKSGYKRGSWTDLFLLAKAYNSVAAMQLIRGYPQCSVLDSGVVPECMFSAVRRCDTVELKALIAIGVAVNSDTMREDSLLHVAFGRNLFGHGADSPGVLVNVLLEAGADWEKCDNRGNAPLHVGIHYGFQSVCKLMKYARLMYTSLHDISLFVNRKNDDNKTALDTVPLIRQRWLLDTPIRDHLVHRILFVRGMQILMACGATVSRKVVVMLESISRNNPPNKAVQEVAMQAISLEMLQRNGNTQHNISLSAVPTDLLRYICSEAYMHDEWLRKLV